VSKLERGLLLVHLLYLSILLLEDLESELVFLFGSVRKALCLHMSGKLLMKFSWSLRLEEILETENGRGFGEMHHL
jgi:hypothetical protein